MSELVEKVARAIYEASHNLQNCYSWDDEWEAHQRHHRFRYLRDAKAAIEATGVEALKHDLDRLAARENEFLNDNALLREALEKVYLKTNEAPIKAIARSALNITKESLKS